MTTDRDLLLAILALDCYNHGYNVGITGFRDQIYAAAFTIDTSDDQGRVLE